MIDAQWRATTWPVIVPLAACAAAFVAWQVRAWWVREMDFMGRVAGGE